MGNRAVITTRENFENNGIGIYLHWNGGRDSVEPFLAYCKMKNYGDPAKDFYGWARLCQVIGNYFGGTNSIGIENVDNLDCDNWDNGVYIIEDWKIVGREFFNGIEQNSYDFKKMLIDIDNSMPESERIGENIIEKLIETEKETYADKLNKVSVGSKISVFDSIYGRWNTFEVLGFGKPGAVVNGHDVGGVPFYDFTKDSPFVDANETFIEKIRRLMGNPNSYLFESVKWLVE